jgi:drug/metabolite transporter (DMT)-like permease
MCFRPRRSPTLNSFVALTFVIVPVLAYLWPGEPLTAKYVLGMGLVIAGLPTLWS